MNTAKEKETQTYSSKVIWITIIAIAFFVGLFFYLNVRNQDIIFSRRVFAGLVKGRTSVQKMIDWEDFQAVGLDVGEVYSGLPDEKEKADYKNSFIDKFSLGFRQVGGNFKAFVNWRVYDRQGRLCRVAADYKAKENKTLLFTLAQGQSKKLVAIQWEDADEK